MAGATVAPSFVTEMHRDLGSANARDVRISIHGVEGTGFEPPSSRHCCLHCDFTANSAAEMTHHRWDVHPLLTRRKQHLMTSPKGVRKRPNSESSSDEGKLTDSDEISPRKKLSPSHVVMTSCDGSADCNHVRRTSSADEIRRLKQAEEQAKHKSHSVGDLHSSQAYVTSHIRQRSEGKCNADDVIITCDTSAPPCGETYPTKALSPAAQHEVEGDLHTLARAALSAAPLVRNKEKDQAIPAPQNWWSYWEEMASNGGSNIAFVPGPLPQMLGHYVPDTNQFQPFRPGLFPAQPSFSVAGSYPPGPSFPLNFPVYLSAPLNVTSQSNKLSTLSDVASRYLAGAVAQEERSAHKEPDNHLICTHRESVLPPSGVTFHQNGATNSRQASRSPAAIVHASQSRPAVMKKSLPIPTPQQRTQEKKPVMDDDRVRSLEEALSKIDCCDTHERSNVLPYRCSDGKWRMVESKCVGGAWVVHVPGALQPSIYLPLQRGSSQQGILDNWLKEQLTASPKSKPRSQSVTEHRNPPPQQRPYATASRFNALATSGRLGIPQRTNVVPSNGDAIKSLLLKKTAVA